MEPLSISVTTRSWSGSTLPRDYVFDRTQKTLSPYGNDGGGAGYATWNPVEPLTFRARDGLMLSGYLTRPDETMYGEGPWPMVVQVHGGPWSGRHSWNFDEEAQRFADQGYVVLAVNFRVTRGWGLALIHQSVWGGTMIEDVEDGIQWAIQSGFADKNRIAMVGASYGGYATLRFVETPLIRCGIAGIPKANLTESNYLFNVEGSGPLEVREARSPDRFTEKLNGPLLIWTGGLDGDDQAEVGPFVSRAQANGKAVTWVRFPREGHGLQNTANYAALTVLKSQFLAQCLGGPSLPSGDVMQHAELEIKAGGELIPALDIPSSPMMADPPSR